MSYKQSLFLRQSYLDAWTEYERSLTSPRAIVWDRVVLTASNESQADAYRMQITMRQEKGLLPSRTAFDVWPDPDGKRVGSGGATLNALRQIAQTEKARGGGEPFNGKRILVIHSGGDSKRVPQYSACGKLFSPVPRELPNGKRSTLFDEFMIGMSGLAGRIREGLLLASGDVLLLFNALQIDDTGEAAAISFKERVEVGQNHGVYQIDEDGHVGAFLHKQPASVLRARGAANGNGLVDIDTGAVLLPPDVLHALYGLLTSDGSPDAEKFDPEKFGRFVNDRARLSLYGDFLYPLASTSTREDYFREPPEGALCDELLQCRAALWEALRPFRMKLFRLSPAAFIHFGTTGELRELVAETIGEFAFLDWSAQVSANVEGVPYAVNNAVIASGAEVGLGAYIEDSVIASASRIGSGAVLSFVALHGESVPDDVVLHGLKLRDGRFVVRAYGVADNPKSRLDDGAAFLGSTLEGFLAINGIDLGEVWPDGDSGRTLWNARLYPVCATMPEAVAAALNVCAMARGVGDAATWRAAERTSLASGFQDADTQAILDWQTQVRKRVKLEKLLNAIRDGQTCETAAQVFAGAAIDDEQKRWLEERAEASDSTLRTRIYFYLGKILGGVEGEAYMDRAFAAVRDGIVQNGASPLQGVPASGAKQIAAQDVSIRLPLRVNWGGGWSDTPPYCNEVGGTVINAAISLNGILPVEVRMQRLDAPEVLFESADVGSHGRFTQIEPLQRCSDPYDPFALHKAALLACGVLPMQGGDLAATLQRLGGGIALSTQVVGVPKGSGLGTSSILAGACVKAAFAFLGQDCPDQEVYARVLCMEQLMSTGGGWQDQVGGVTMGIKYTTSAPGLKQRLRVQAVRVPDAAMDELRERFALIYTGQRRLARHLLRDVMGHYVGQEPDAIHVLDAIQQSAAMMKFELERGQIDAFAALLGQHWELSKRLDQGSTNTCIDQIFLTIDDLIAGKMICGAGGGGFLQVVLKKGITKDRLRFRLNQVFQDSGVDVWDCDFV